LKTISQLKKFMIKQKLWLSLMMIFVTLYAIDQNLATKGTFEPCEKFRIGNSFYYLQFFSDMVRGESAHHEYYMKSPCQKSVKYIFEFSTNLIVPRVSKIIIKYPGDSSLATINNALGAFGFDKSIESKKLCTIFLNRSQNIKFSISGLRDLDSHRPVYFTIFR